jgi:hypothetical protein
MVSHETHHVLLQYGVLCDTTSTAAVVSYGTRHLLLHYSVSRDTTCTVAL